MHEDGPKRPVTGTLVKVLLHRRNDRGMVLEGYASRCVRRGEIHELVTTDHTETGASARIDRVGFLGFVEISRAGVIDRGDDVWINDHLVGTILGFDACHFPNHYNILIFTDVPQSGLDLDLEPGTSIRFEASSRCFPAQGSDGEAERICSHPRAHSEIACRAEVATTDERA